MIRSSGGDLEFLERKPGAAPWVERMHCFTFPAFMSHGPLTGDIPAISVGAERVAQRHCRRAVRRGLRAAIGRACSAGTRPSCSGDEYVLDEDVAKFAAETSPSGA